MKSTSGSGLALCVVFGSLLLALIAELYYLLCWKKKKIKTITTKIDQQQQQQQQQNTLQIQIQPKRSNLFTIFKRPTSSLCNTSPTLVHDPQSSIPNNKDSWLNKPFSEQNMGSFPRFLFTITEETREDLESEDGFFKNVKNSTSRSNLSDLIQILETPFLTPLASPPYFTPPLTPSSLSHFWERGEEMMTSPPPVFKFLRDAEEKMVQRMMVVVGGGDDQQNGGDDRGEFITLVIDGKQEERDGICIKNCFKSNLEEEECFSSRSSSHR